MGWADTILYRFARMRNRKANQTFQLENPSVIVPADHFLYETYRLDQRKFIENGRLAAGEIHDWTSPYFSSPPKQVLDWGCGVGRIIRHMPAIFPESTIHGCDTNTSMVGWNVSHYPGIHFTVSDHHPPTDYLDAKFELVYGFSVLTHIDARQQLAWIKELHRIIAKKGILIITTHGDHYTDQLTGSEKRRLHRDGIYTRSYRKKGHRAMATYHAADKFRKILAPFFTVLEYYDGQWNINKIGGQDLWLLQKR